MVPAPVYDVDWFVKGEIAAGIPLADSDRRSCHRLVPSDDEYDLTVEYV